MCPGHIGLRRDAVPGGVRGNKLVSMLGRSTAPFMGARPGPGLHNTGRVPRS